MGKLKVSDLPKEEQEKLIDEAKSLDIKGVYLTWTEETLRAKINDAKAKLNDKQAGDEKDADAEKDNGEDAQNDAKNDADDTKQADDEKDAKKGVINAQKNKPVEKALRCHICLSKVVNGKCTGCGFELKK